MIHKLQVFRIVCIVPFFVCIQWGKTVISLELDKNGQFITSHIILCVFPHSKYMMCGVEILCIYLGNISFCIYT